MHAQIHKVENLLGTGVLDVVPSHYFRVGGMCVAYNHPLTPSLFSPYGYL